MKSFRGAVKLGHNWYDDKTVQVFVDDVVLRFYMSASGPIISDTLTLVDKKSFDRIGPEEVLPLYLNLAQKLAQQLWVQLKRRPDSFREVAVPRQRKRGLVSITEQFDHSYAEFRVREFMNSMTPHTH